MNNEYIIINKSQIEKRIEEWETELQECFKAPIGKFNSDYVSTLQQAITTAREILSQSTPLIPEIEKVYNYNLNKKEFGWYISNLKLDIQK